MSLARAMNIKAPDPFPGASGLSKPSTALVNQVSFIEKQRQGVGKTIAEIQCGTMSTLAELRERQTGQFSLTAIHADDLNLGCIQQAIEIGLSVGAETSSDHNGELYKGCRREGPLVCCRNGHVERMALRLVLEDGEDGR